MKKIILLTAILLVGCTNTKEVKEEKKEILKKEISCSVEGSNFKLILENGQITKYIDEVEGELEETVGILNEEHLKGVNDNDKATEIMNEALKDLGGYCK